MRKLLALSALTVVILSFSGCTQIAREIIGAMKSAATDASDSASSVEVLNDAGNLSLTIPGNWEKSADSGNEDVSLYVTNKSKDQLVMVITESTIDYEDSFDLAQYSNTVMTMMSENITNAQWTDVTDITVAGYPAKYVEVTGSVDGIKLQYFIKFIKTDSYFTQLIGSTLLSKADKNRDNINNITDTFKEAM